MLPSGIFHKALQIRAYQIRHTLTVEVAAEAVVGRHDNVVHIPQLRLLRQRLRLKHVQHGSPQSPALQAP